MKKRRDAKCKDQIVRKCLEVNPESLPNDTQGKMSEMSRRLKDLSNENARLKKVLAEQEIERAILQELLDLPKPK
jgi:hypothetical protein